MPDTGDNVGSLELPTSANLNMNSTSDTCEQSNNRESIATAQSCLAESEELSEVEKEW